MKVAFPSVAIRVGSAPGSIIVMAAKHPAVGDVSIQDDGEEVTLHIGELTHGHFSSPDPSLPQGEAAARITSAVVEFLEDLFADRVVVWRGPGGATGGWRVISAGSEVESGSIPGVKRFLWSGPIA